MLIGILTKERNFTNAMPEEGIFLRGKNAFQITWGYELIMDFYAREAPGDLLNLIFPDLEGWPKSRGGFRT